jgi:hypothetical protein
LNSAKWYASLSFENDGTLRFKSLFHVGFYLFRWVFFGLGLDILSMKYRDGILCFVVLGYLKFKKANTTGFIILFA